jgi:hypothetical protein
MEPPNNRGENMLGSYQKECGLAKLDTLASNQETQTDLNSTLEHSTFTAKINETLNKEVELKIESANQEEPVTSSNIKEEPINIDQALIEDAPTSRELAATIHKEDVSIINDKEIVEQASTNPEETAPASLGEEVQTNNVASDSDITISNKTNLIVNKNDIVDGFKSAKSGSVVLDATVVDIELLPIRTSTEVIQQSTNYRKAPIVPVVISGATQDKNNHITDTSVQKNNLSKVDNSGIDKNNKIEINEDEQRPAGSKKYWIIVIVAALIVTAIVTSVVYGKKTYANILTTYMYFQFF